MPTATVSVRLAPLREWAIRLLVKRGMYSADAELASQRLMEAELLGRSAGGLRWLPRLLEAMDLGDIDPRAQLVSLDESPALSAFDGSTGVGQVAVTRALEHGVKSAQAVGSAIVIVKNSRPLGDPTACLIAATSAGYLAGIMTACKPETEPWPIGPCTAWAWPGDDSPLVATATPPVMTADIAAEVLPTALGGTKPVSTKKRLFADDAEHVCFVIDISKGGNRGQFDVVANQAAAPAS